MIRAEVMLDDDTPVATLWLRAKPAVGEYLWVSGSDRERVVDQFGASSLLVKEVAHWVSGDWRPGTHTGEPIHSLAIYVEPVLPAEEAA